MASSLFLILLLKCIDFLSWPMLALGYPLCASIYAIENDSHSETRNLISYWILLSLIYLFEYAFLQLLQWFQYWHYMKLMLVAFLAIPDFGGAAYVYDHLIQSCIYMNPKEVISRFRNWENIFDKKQDFIVQVENYVTQNGTEALEKLITSKKTEQSPLHAETRKAVPRTTEKNEILKTNRERLLMEKKDIKDLEMIDKEEVCEGKQDNAALDSLKSKESASSAMAKAENMPADTEHGTHANISAAENVQKEWTCAICQLTMPSEAILNSHLQGRKHKAACEALNTMKIKAALMKNTGTRASPQVSASAMVKESTSSAMAKAENMPTDTADAEHGTHAKISAAEKAQKEWTCAICQLTMPSEAILNSHLQGRKHKAACEALNTMKIKAALMKNTGTRASPQVSASAMVKESTSSAMAKAENMPTDTADAEHGTHAKISAAEKAQKEWTCAICQLTMPSEAILNSHLQGRKHKAACEALNTMKIKAALMKNTGTRASPQVSASAMVKESTSSAMAKAENMPTDTADAEHGTHAKISAAEKAQKEWTCAICQLTMPSEANLNSHLQGRKHKAACEALNTTKTIAATMKNTGIRACPEVSASKNVQNMYTCAVCQLTKLTMDNIKTHLNGKKHKAACEALYGKSQGVSEKGLLKKNDNSIGEQEKIIINMTTSNVTLDQKNITNKHHPKMEHNNNINQQKNLGKPVLEMNSSRFRCDMCDVNCTWEGDLASHLQGKKHLAQIQLLSGST